MSNLPTDSALATAYGPDEWRNTGWGVQHELSATLVDAIGILDFHLVKAFANESVDFEPMRVPRPFESLRKPMSSPDELRKFFAAGTVKYTPKPQTAPDPAVRSDQHRVD